MTTNCEVITISSKKEFEQSTLTWYDVVTSITDETTPKTIVDGIFSCTAKMTGGGYILREKQSTGYTYVAKTSLEIRDIFSMNLKINNGQSIKTRKLYDIINDKEFNARWKYYTGVKLMSADSYILCLYVPPLHPQADVQKAKDLVEFLRSRVKNPRAFDEYCSSHAFRLRNRNAFIEKVFVFFSIQGNTGKSFTASMFGLLYPNLANTGVKHSQLTETINGWATKYAYIHVEELEGEEYADKKFATWAKQATTRNGSVRLMRTDTFAGENTAIVGILYGLMDARDPALVQRLVILEFDSPPTPDEWLETKQYFGVDDSAPNFVDTRNRLAAGLAIYLQTEYPIVAGFNPCRYSGKDKEDTLKRLRNLRASVPEQFINQLDKLQTCCKNDEYDPRVPAEYRVFDYVHDKRSKDSDKSLRVIARISSLREAWRKHQADKTGSQASYKFETSVVPLLEQIGFTKVHTRSGDAFSCTDVAKFEEWYAGRNNLETLEFLEDEDSESVDAINAVTIQKKRSCSPQ